MRGRDLANRQVSPRRSTGRRRSLPRPRDLDAEVVEQTLGSVLKYREDIETVRDETLVGLIEEARATREPLGSGLQGPRSSGTS